MVSFRLNERGASLALVTVVMVGLLACMALAIDMGFLYTARGEARRAADAAALAGASAFLDIDYTNPASETEARTRAMYIAIRNHMAGSPIDTGEVTIQVIRDSQKVRVWVRRAEVPTWFARFFGVFNKPVGAHAAAQANNAGTAKCVKPFLFADYWGESDSTQDRAPGNRAWDYPDPNSKCGANGNECWIYEPPNDHYRPFDPDDTTNPAVPQTGFGSSYRNMMAQGGNRYKEDRWRPHLAYPGVQTGQNTVPSNYNLWSLNDPGGDAVRDAFAATECSGLTASIGDTIYTDKPGATAGPVNQGIQDWYDQDPSARWEATGVDVDGYTTGRIVSDVPGYDGLANPRVFLAGIIHPQDVISGRTDLAILNLGLFFLETRPSGSNPQPIRVRFIRYARGLGGPETGTLIKVLQLVE